MIKVSKPFVDAEEAEAVREVLLSGNYVSGRRVAEFEKRFAEYIGVEYAVAVNSGTAALQLALGGLGIGVGDEVLVPALTFFATVSSVIMQGAVPIFVDIDPDTYCIDPADMENKITQRTAAVIPVHYFGQSADMDAVMSLAGRHGFSVVEDCAQAHGTKYRGRITGSIGSAGAFSFFATKHMTTGEGGIITTNDEKLAAKARAVRSHGMTDRDTHEYLGYNFRMTEIAAAIGLVQLEKLNGLNARRVRNSLYLIEKLAGVDWLIPPVLLPHVEHTFFWAAFKVDEKTLGYNTEELIGKLRQRGVEVRNRYKEPLNRQKIFKTLQADKKSIFGNLYKDSLPDYDSIKLPVAEDVAGRVIGLPNHPGLEREDLDMVVDVIKDI